MDKLLLFWISCGVSIEQEILLSICFSRNASQDRKQNSQTSQHLQFANFVQGNLPTRLIPSCLRERSPKEGKQYSRHFCQQLAAVPRLHYDVHITQRTYNTLYVQYGIHVLIRVCQSLSLAKYMVLTILMLILPAAPKHLQAAETRAKHRGSDKAIHKVLGGTEPSHESPAGS